MLSSLAIVALVAASVFCMREMQKIRTQAFARILFDEIEVISKLRGTLGAIPEFSDSSFAIELMDREVVVARRNFHLMLAQGAGLGDMISTVSTNSAAASSEHLAWLGRVRENLRQSASNVSSIRWLSARVEAEPAIRKSRDKHAELPKLWAKRAQVNREMGRKLYEDFQRDRALLCHSRKNLAQMQLTERYLQEKCKKSGPACRDHQQKLNLKLRDLASVEQTNEHKFGSKWGETRLQWRLCE
jgi:hypothetical protein